MPQPELSAHRKLTQDALAAPLLAHWSELHGTTLGGGLCDAMNETCGQTASTGRECFSSQLSFTLLRSPPKQRSVSRSEEIHVYSSEFCYTSVFSRSNHDAQHFRSYDVSELCKRSGKAFQAKEAPRVRQHERPIPSKITRLNWQLRMSIPQPRLQQ
jgi:hypothetical protein